ncbi:MAG: hypothetical protein AAF160_02785 [Pseudomonadota bacterium]
MFLELLATVVAGFACAGVVMLANAVSGRRLPRWLTPVAAGVGMLGMTISNEYSWFDRTAARLPEGVEVATTVEERSWLRPWTRIHPYTKRFVAVDRLNARTNDNLPDQRLVSLYFFGRWSPVNTAPVLFDCAAGRSAILIDGADFDEDGRVVDADWQAMQHDDPVLKMACET